MREHRRDRAASEGRRLKVGVMLPAYDLMGRSLAISEVADYAVEAERLGFDSVWASDHFHGDELLPGGGGGRFDPLLTLAYLAAATNSVTLGTLVLSNAFRPAAQLAREIASLSNLAPGRLVVGMGSGGRDSELELFGFHTDNRASRLRETLEVIAPLLAGGAVTHMGRHVQLRNAELRLDVPRPPLWVAAFGPRMQEIAAELADGWNTAWHGPETGRFEEELRAFRAACTRLAAVQQPAPTISVGLRMVPLAGRELAAVASHLERLRPDPAPMFWETALAEHVVTGEADALARTMLAYADCGAEHIILNLSQMPTMLLEREYLARAAEMLPLLR